MDALTFLDTPPAKRQPIYALFGDEDFLKRRCRDAAIKLALGDDADPEFAVASYQGDKLDFSTVRNELETLPFLAPARVVVIEPADAFVTENRDNLEKYAAAPSKVGVLILDVKSFPETTKLAKALPDAAKLSCKAPPPATLSGWCVKWAKAGHGKKMTPDAAGLLLDLIGPSMGQLDQELEKLASAVGAKADITADDVDRLVGRSRAANVFHILDAIGDGKPADALNILAQLLDAGDDPMKVLGALTHQLRKLATVGRLLNQGLTLFPAMDEAGIGKWPQARQGAERQVKHLGRARLNQLPDWLVDINYGLKGGNPLPPRVQLERLVARLAAPLRKG